MLRGQCDLVQTIYKVSTGSRARGTLQLRDSGAVRESIRFHQIDLRGTCQRDRKSDLTNGRRVDSEEAGAVTADRIRASDVLGNQPSCGEIVAAAGDVSGCVGGEHSDLAIWTQVGSSVDLVDVGAIQAGDRVVTQRRGQHDAATSAASSKKERQDSQGE